MMKCPYCSAENEEESKFCEKCGKSLTEIVVKKKKTGKWKAILIVFCLCALVVSGIYVAYVRNIGKKTYTYNPVKEKINVIVDLLSGNKNEIEMPDDKKDMKIYAENIADNVLGQMRQAVDSGMPTEVCNIADKYKNNKSRKIASIDSYSGISEDILSEMQEIENVTETDIMHASLLTLIGNVAGADFLAFSSSFQTEMEVDTEKSVPNEVWVINYSDDFSVGVVFTEEETVLKVEAWPIVLEDRSVFDDKIDLFFSNHTEYK